MVEYIIALLLVAVALLMVSLRRTYNFFPVRELKRQARAGDRDAATLYRAVAYGASLRLLLWMIIGLCVAASFALFAVVAPAWLAGLAIVAVIWYGFAWAPNGQVGTVGARITLALTPALAWLLYHTHRPLDWLARTTDRFRHVSFHTGLFERSDLVDLIEQQRSLSDNRIAPGELDIVLGALSFGQKTVGSTMLMKRDVKSIKEDDVVGPILLDELYESKHSRFPVISHDGKSVIGLLFLRHIVAAKQGGTVRELMKPAVNFVHEKQTLYQVLHAFLQTKHQLFVVVDDHEHYIGIITIEDVIEQIVGHKIVDDFDSYDNKAAVAEHGRSAT